MHKGGGGDQPSLRARGILPEGSSHVLKSVQKLEEEGKELEMEKVPSRNHLLRRSRCGRDSSAFRDLAQLEAGVRGGARGKAEAGPGMPGREPLEGLQREGPSSDLPVPHTPA